MPRAVGDECVKAAPISNVQSPWLWDLSRSHSLFSRADSILTRISYLAAPVPTMSFLAAPLRSCCPMATVSSRKCTSKAFITLQKASETDGPGDHCHPVTKHTLTLTLLGRHQVCNKCARLGPNRCKTKMTAGRETEAQRQETDCCEGAGPQRLPARPP